MTVLCEVLRSGVVESRHHGSVIATAPGGKPRFRIGDPGAPIFPRSCNKPLQGVAMVRSGLELPGELMALACSSHAGESFHEDGVRRILGLAGLSEGALGNTPGLPLDARRRWEVVRDGGEPTRIANNCSGKHAAMLLTCVRRGWPTDGYLDPAHPLQETIAETVSELAGERPAHVGVDGCGAPIHAVSLAGLARAYRTIGTAGDGAEAEVAAAMRAHPAWVGGPRRIVTAYMANVPGLLAKDGAESVCAVAFPDGRGAAFKIDDGSARAVAPVLSSLLRALGADTSAAEAALRAVAPTQEEADGTGGGEVRAVPFDDAAPAAAA
ncbi:MAG: asparaginase [Solirubrobacteraceae bacterium]